jgi:hypothetical protein
MHTNVNKKSSYVYATSNLNIKYKLSFSKHIPYQDSNDAYKAIILSMKINHIICLRSQAFKLINIVLLFSHITSLVTKLIINKDKSEFSMQIKWRGNSLQHSTYSLP